MVRQLKSCWTCKAFKLNALSAVVIALVEVAGYLAGFGWSILFSIETAMKITLGCNLAYILLKSIASMMKKDEDQPVSAPDA